MDEKRFFEQTLDLGFIEMLIVKNCQIDETLCGDDDKSVEPFLKREN